VDDIIVALNDFSLQGKQPRSSSVKKNNNKKPRRGGNRRGKMGQAPSFAIDPDTPPLTLKECSLNAVAEFIKSGRARRIVVMTGAGISTAAGSVFFLSSIQVHDQYANMPPVPDFRSPDTGLYSNLMDLDLPEPEAIFDIEYFRTNPKPFYVLAKELYPGRYHPTISHVFISLLARKGLLHMLFTQNIDCLERAAGIPPELIVEAHGSFATQRCIVCKAPFDDVKMKEFVSQAKVPHCEEEGCNGLVKPDITFFGEALPRKFYENIDYARTADLVIVMGTSLLVQPFASLPNYPPDHVPRVLINREQVGNFGSRADDVMLLMDCDKGVRDLANALGWKDELEEMWKGIVGEKEAERQIQGSGNMAMTLQNEVNKLAEVMDEALTLDGQKKGKEGEEGKAKVSMGEVSKTEDKEQKDETGQKGTFQEGDVQSAAQGQADRRESDGKEKL